MAGWSKLAEAVDLGFVKTPTKLEPSESLADIELPSSGSYLEVELEGLRSIFDKLLVSFLQNVHARECFRSFPPMLGDGQPVNLFNLFLAVREKGGYNVVSENRLWGFVADECGLGLIGASPIKLVYAKYLEAFERLLDRIVESNGLKSEQSITDRELSGKLMGLDKDLEVFLLELGKKQVVNPQVEASLLSNSDVLKTNANDIESMQSDSTKRVLDFGEVQKLENDGDANNMMVDVKDSVVDAPIEEIKCAIGDNGNEGGSHKRKRESMSKMLDWVTKVAKDPHDPVVGSLPERSKWKSYSTDELWRQVLWYREVTFTPRCGDSSVESYWQKAQKMHPCMYDDQFGTAYNLRERLSCNKNLLSGSKTEASSSKQADLENGSSGDGTSDSAVYSVFDYDIDYQIPIGPDFQAELPECAPGDYKPDPNWLGNRIWPMEKKENNGLIERDPIGKGRQEPCGCRSPGSIQCVKFHIEEKRKKVKLELRSAFYLWKFHRMGEEVLVYWRGGDQKIFDSVMKANLLSPDLTLLDKMRKQLPNKSREDLISFYFNVYILQRRAYQNRHSPDKIDSDDDGGEHQILLTPKKSRKTSR